MLNFNFKNGSLVVLVIVLRSSVGWVLVSVDNASYRVPSYLVLCIHRVERVD